MTKLKRGRLSDAMIHEIFDRWEQGQTHLAIAHAIGKSQSTVFGVLRRHGGFRPPVRRRAPTALTFEEREEVSRGLAAGVSIRAIARALGRSPSTVSREVGRNGGTQRYRAAVADERAWARAKRPKACRLKQLRPLRLVVREKLELNWSPEQIAAWLKREYPGNDAMQVSHETIYRTLYVQARGALKKELHQHLRRRRHFRQARTYTTKGREGGIADAVSIAERPPEADDRAVPGHWEGDLIAGTRNTHIATLVERATRFTMLVKVDGKDTGSVVPALAEKIARLPAELRRSLTWDRGTELAAHAQFSVATDVDVYFCDPASPWQRGSNENTNGLLRQYFPKGTDLSVHSQKRLDQVAEQLNMRPRKTLGWDTPADRLLTCVAPTR